METAGNGGIRRENAEYLSSMRAPQSAPTSFIQSSNKLKKKTAEELHIQI